jgi:hypothetical protein
VDQHESGQASDVPGGDVKADPVETLTDHAMPDATIEVAPVVQTSWLDDDLFAA